jgi:hypothetical protein
MVSIKVLGIYPIKANQPVHLIEVQISNSSGMFNVSKFTQEIDSQPELNWQAPYMEYILNAEGNKILADDYTATKMPELWKGDVRMTFFFHYLDKKKPLRTPFGEVSLPTEIPLPKRLKIIKYEPVD